MKSEEANWGKQAVLQWRKLGKILIGKCLPAGLQPGHRMACLRFQPMNKITLKHERPLIKSKERKQLEGSIRTAFLSQTSNRGFRRSCRTGPVTFSLMTLVLRDEDTAFQLSRGFPGAEPSRRSCLIAADQQRAFTPRPNLSDHTDPSPQVSSSNNWVKKERTNRD